MSFSEREKYMQKSINMFDESSDRIIVKNMLHYLRLSKRHLKAPEIVSSPETTCQVSRREGENGSV